jgi:hypothetical protein
MKLKAIKQKSSGRDSESRWESRQRKNVEAMVRLFLRTSAARIERREEMLREELGEDFSDFVEVTP